VIEISQLEERRSRWGVRTSNPGRAARRSLVGSTPTLFRHPVEVAVTAQGFPFLDRLKTAADTAAAAEATFRQQAAQRVAALDRERAFAFRRLNLMRAIADAIVEAETEEQAVASALATLRAKLEWSSDSDARALVLSRFCPVAQAVFANLMASDNDASLPDVAQALVIFENWYAETRGSPFWSLFDHYRSETPVVDF
jgi:hypothetical protein